MTYQTVTKYLAKFKTTKGKWNLTVRQKKQKLESSFSPAVVPPIEQNLIPEVDPNFVKFGNFPDVKKIIQSKEFYPCFITGLSGNGKTLGVEQQPALNSREKLFV